MLKKILNINFEIFSPVLLFGEGRGGLKCKPAT